MFVKDYMTRHPIMIEPDKFVSEAQRIMGENHIRHLPVVDDGKKLVGLVTRSHLHIPPEKLTSLNVWEITRFLSKLQVKDVMVKGQDLKTISPEETLEQAALKLTTYKIHALPVVEDGRVVGILTETDLLVELRNLLGANEPGWRVTMRVPNSTGQASKLSNFLSGRGWDVMALGSVRTPKDPDHWDLVLKVAGSGSKEDLVAGLATVDGQMVVDVRECE